MRANVQIATMVQAVGTMLALTTAAKPIANLATAVTSQAIIIRANVQIATMAQVVGTM